MGPNMCAGQPDLLDCDYYKAEGNLEGNPWEDEAVAPQCNGGCPVKVQTYQQLVHIDPDLRPGKLILHADGNMNCLPTYLECASGSGPGTEYDNPGDVPGTTPGDRIEWDAGGCTVLTDCTRVNGIPDG